MPVINNPINKPHLDYYAAASLPSGVPAIPVAEYEVGRRAEEIMSAWLKIYFGGALFQIAGASGVLDDYMFPECSIITGEAKIENPSELPTIHAIIADEQATRHVLGDGLVKVKAVMRWNIYVRTTRQHRSEGVAGKHLATRIAAQLLWLLHGSEKQGLAAKGMRHVDVVRGPVPLQNPNYFMRQFVVSMKPIYHVRNNY